MTATITKAPRDPDSPVQPPSRDGGGIYEWSMLLPGGYRYAWGDTVADLVSILAADPTYTIRSEQERLVVRIEAALHLQVTVQARINSEAVLSGAWARLCQWEHRVMNGPRHVAPNMPDGFPTRALFNGADVWTAPVMLLCLTTASEPLNPGVPPILGTEESVGVIDPIDDESFLDSLGDLGIVRVFRWEEGDGYF